MMQSNTTIAMITHVVTADCGTGIPPPMGAIHGMFRRFRAAHQMVIGGYIRITGEFVPLIILLHNEPCPIVKIILVIPASDAVIYVPDAPFLVILEPLFPLATGLNMDDYISLTSFTHHPFQRKF